MEEAAEEPRKLGPELKPLVPGSQLRDTREAEARPWRWLVAVGAILIIAVAVMATMKLIRASAPAAKLPLAGRLALLPFVDATVERSSGWIETGLMEMVAEAVAQTAPNAIVPPLRLRKAFEPRGFDLHDPATRERARRLAFATGASQVLDVTVTGEHAKGYAMELELFDEGGAVASTRLERSDPMAAADALALSLARGLSSDREPYRLQLQFSHSPFVDRLYATGLAELRTGSAPAARPYFEIALRHRPAFFQAKAQLADCMRQLGELDSAVELTNELIREAQSRGERLMEARSLRRLASLQAIQGRLDEASALYTQAYAVHLDLSDRAAQQTALY